MYLCVYLTVNQSFSYLISYLGTQVSSWPVDQDTRSFSRQLEPGHLDRYIHGHHHQDHDNQRQDHLCRWQKKIKKDNKITRWSSVTIRCKWFTSSSSLSIKVPCMSKYWRRGEEKTQHAPSNTLSHTRTMNRKMITYTTCWLECCNFQDLKRSVAFVSENFINGSIKCTFVR